MNIKQIIAQAVKLDDNEIDFVTMDDDMNLVKGPDGLVGWFNGKVPECFIGVDANVVRTALEVRDNLANFLDDTLVAFALNRDRKIEEIPASGDINADDSDGPDWD